MKKDLITSSSLLQYGILAAPVAFAGFPLYILAPDFYATKHNASLATLGITLLGLRLFDAFQDPLIGVFSDRYRRHTGYIIVLSAALLCAAIYGLFNQLFLSPLVWFALCMGLAVTAYSMLSIKLNALGALWTKDFHQQTRIAASRESFALLGLVSAVSLPGLLTNIMPQSYVYHYFALALGALMGLAMLLFLRWYKSHGAYDEHKVVSSPLESIKTLSPDSRKLMFVYLISMMASSVPAILVIFFVRDLLNAEKYTGLFLLLYFLSGACFMLVWKRISIIHGKYRSWMASMLLAVTSFIWSFTLNEGDIWQYAAICTTSGIALGADLIFPPSILADQLHLHRLEKNSSTHYAVLALVAKASLAFASAISLPLLESVDFIPDGENSPSALARLRTAYALIPCLIKCIAAGLLWRMFIHPNKGSTHEDNNNINCNPRRTHDA